MGTFEQPRELPVPTVADDTAAKRVPDPAVPGAADLLCLQRLAGNRVVTSLLRDPARLRRQLATGVYSLKEKARLRADDEGHSQTAELPAEEPVSVIDKGGRTSLFKAGLILTNEHSWSRAADQRTGWIQDSHLRPVRLTEALGVLFARDPKPTAKEIAEFVNGATSPQKQEAASDEAFLAKAKQQLSNEAYLDLLPALGVHRTPTMVSSPRPGPGPQGHMTAEQADNAIRQHLVHYLADAVAKGRKIEGEVSVVGDGDFQAAFDRQWVVAAGQTQWLNTKATDVCDAFVDVNLPGRHIWVHRNFGDFGTVVHEGMHKYSDSSLRDEQILLAATIGVSHGGTSRLDEGITEYFARKVLAQMGIPRTNYYQGEFQVAAKLAGTYGEASLAKAYYDGQFATLKSAVGAGWPELAKRIEQSDWVWLQANGHM